MPHFPQTPFDAPRKSYRDSTAYQRSSVMRDGTSAWPLKLSVTRSHLEKVAKP